MLFAFHREVRCMSSNCFRVADLREECCNVNARAEKRLKSRKRNQTFIEMSKKQ